MNPVKWLRKNNKKVMVFVVIVIMFGFIGGTYISQWGRHTGKETVAYACGRRITNYDLFVAQRQLDILDTLGTRLLLSPPPQATAGAELRSVFLGELLFSGRGDSRESARSIRRIARANNYAISDEEIGSFYRAKQAGRVYWLLLTREAAQAGVQVPIHRASETLNLILPRIYRGAFYSQIVSMVMNRYGIGEKQILGIFAELLAILEYSRMTCDMQAVTRSQIAHETARQVESINAEYVEFDAKSFAEQQPDPTEQRVVEHFDKYRDLFEGDFSEENPAGFGYRLPNAASVEYLAVLLEDAKSTVEPPSQEDLELYYQTHRKEFIASVPSDPNDPNSPAATRVRSYAEMANTIRQMLVRKAIDSKARLIIEEAVSMTALQEDSQETGEYGTIAETLTGKYGVRVYSGRTGLLSAEEFRRDEYLSSLYLEQGDSFTELLRLVFNMEEFDAKAGAIEAQPPAADETIGPLADFGHRIVATVRVLDTRKAREPQLDESFSIAKVELSDKPEREPEVFSVRQKVIEDIKILSGMDRAREKAGALLEDASGSGWETAIETLNSAGDNKQAPSNAHRLETRNNILRPGAAEMEALLERLSPDPLGRAMIHARRLDAAFAEALCRLVEPGSTSTNKLVVFEPGRSCYAIKEVSRNQLNRTNYEQDKARTVYLTNIRRSQSLAPVHFMPDNITARTSFRWVKEDDGSPGDDS